MTDDDFLMPDTMRMDILRCTLRYQCSKRWDELASTENAEVRKCSECLREVHLCVDQTSLDAIATKGACVAFLTTSEPEGVRITLGLPAGSRANLQKALDEL